LNAISTKTLKAYVKNFIHEFILEVEEIFKDHDNELDVQLSKIQLRVWITHKNIIQKLELPSKNFEEKKIQEKIKKIVYSNHLNYLKAGKFKTAILCIRAWEKLHKDTSIKIDDYDNDDYKAFKTAIKQLVTQIDESNFETLNSNDVKKINMDLSIQKNPLKHEPNFTPYSKLLFKKIWNNINRNYKIFLIQMQIRDLIIDLIALQKEKNMKVEYIEYQTKNYINMTKKEILKIIKKLSSFEEHFQKLVKDLMNIAFETILKNPPEIYFKEKQILCPKELIQAIFVKFGQFMYCPHENGQSYEIFTYHSKENESALILKVILLNLKI